MVQVLPPVPTFGSRLAEALSGAASNYFQGQREKKIQANDKMILEKASDPNLTPFQRANLYAGLSQPKLQALGPTLAALSKSGVKSQEEENRIRILSGIPGFEFLRQGQGPSQQVTPLNAAMQDIQAPPQNSQVPGQIPLAGMQNVGEIMQEQENPQKPTPSKIPSQEDINKAFAADPSGKTAKILQDQRDEAMRQQKFEFEKSEAAPERQREKTLAAEQAKADAAYVKNHNESRSKQMLKSDSLNRIENQVKRGVSGKIWEKLADLLGLTAITSSGRRELGAEIKNQFTDFKQVAGSQLSAAEFFVLANAYPNIDFSKEANLAIIDNLRQVHDYFDKEDEVLNDLIKENKGKIPENVQMKVNEKMQGYLKDRLAKMKENIKIIKHEQYGIPKGYNLMFAPDGEPLSVSDNEIEKYKAIGATFDEP